MSERADLAQMVEDRVNGMMEELERLGAIEAAARELFDNAYVGSELRPEFPDTYEYLQKLRKALEG